MNKIRERVLTDKGFAESNEGHQTREDSHQRIVRLEGELMKMHRLMRQKDEVWEQQRSVRMIKLSESADQQRQENDETQKENARMKRQLEALVQSKDEVQAQYEALEKKHKKLVAIHDECRFKYAPEIQEANQKKSKKNKKVEF